MEWLKKLLRAIVHLGRKQEVVMTAIKEVADLVPVVDNMVGVLTALRSLAPEFEKYLEDGVIDTGEAIRLIGRLKEIARSGDDVLKEAKEALDALRAVYNVAKGGD